MATHTQNNPAITCIELVASVFQPEEVVYHGGLANTPRSQEQHHGLGSNLPICRQQELDMAVTDEVHTSHRTPRPI